MTGLPILSLLTFLPLVGAFLILAVRGPDSQTAPHARQIALYASGLVFGLSLALIWQFDPASSTFQFVEKASWIPALGVDYHLGVDGISVFFVVLSAFLTPVCILASWRSIETRVREYMAAFLVLETMMIGTFCALDGALFYVFFEGVLLPMFFIIGVWGGPRRVYAAYKFFLYTLVGSVLMLLALLFLFATFGTTAIPDLMDKAPSLATHIQMWLFAAFFASFAVKMPMWPVHTWLPDAHVEAPTAGSVILAGILLKMGGYGFLRFSLPMFPDASAAFAPAIFSLSVIAIIYTSLVALVQEDMKKLIAYSSVAHMGYVTLGIFTLTPQGVDGAMVQMLSHGVVSAALFLCVGVVYDRLHTRDIVRYGGIVGNMPRYALVFMIFMLGSVGLPGTSGFIGEFLTLLGTFQIHTGMAILATSGVVLGAAYMLMLYRRVVFGPVVNADAARMPDLNGREKLCLVPLVLMVVGFGVFPGPVMDRMAPSVDALVTHVQNHASAPEDQASSPLDVPPLKGNVPSVVSPPAEKAVP